MNKLSKSVRILDILEARGAQGMTFTDIQAELWIMSHPGKGEEFDCDLDYTGKARRLRGYWCTNLLGGMHYHAGLLRFYADKGPDGLWRRNAKRHNGHPWRWMGGKHF